MNLQKIIESFLAQYGRQFCLNNLTGKCILSKKGGQNADYLQPEIHRLGSKVNGKYIMFCVHNTNINVGDIIEVASLNYIIDAVENYFIGDIPIYKWAILTKGGCLFEWYKWA